VPREGRSRAIIRLLSKAGRGRDQEASRAYRLVTVKDLLEGKKLQLPESRVDVTFKKAPRSKAKQRALGEGP